jgi:xylulokinase
MNNHFLIGVDIGTQGTKAILFSEDGKCIAQGFQKSNLVYKENGAIEEVPEEQVDAVCNSIAECISKSAIPKNKIAAISISGQMAGIIGIDKTGNSITPYDSWLDTRCSYYINKMQQEAGLEIQEKTGNYPSYNHGPKILWWKYEHPYVYDKIAAFVQPAGYASLRLCGLDAAAAFIDRTYLHFSGFANNQLNIWDEGLCKQFDVDIKKLPAIVEPVSIVGKLEKNMSNRCGLMEGTPVIAGCGDTVASFLSVGATSNGICVDVAGTASVFATTTNTFIIDKEHKILGCGQSAIKGLWHPYAYINGGGMNLEWFVKQLDAININHSNISFDKLNEDAFKLISKEDDPYFIPHLGGRVCPSQPHLRGAWVNLNWTHSFTHLYKAVMEGVALEYGVYSNILKKASPQYLPSEVRTIGGGSKSNLWNQIKADALGIPVTRLIREDGAPLGAALIAGCGVGLFSDLNTTAEKWIATSCKTEPNKLMKELYTKRIRKYMQIIDALVKIEL